MLMDLIKSRHSIRKYTDEQIKKEDLEKNLEAGNYAPNAGGGQRSRTSGRRDFLYAGGLFSHSVQTGMPPENLSGDDDFPADGSGTKELQGSILYGSKVSGVRWRNGYEFAKGWLFCTG